jgi:hypothetical protein
MYTSYTVFARCFQLIILAALISVPALADGKTLPGHPKQLDRPNVQSGTQRPDSRHFSQGTAEGVHSRHDVPRFRHDVSRIGAKPGPKDSYVATGQGVIISSPGRRYHGGYHRRHRRYYYDRTYWVPGYWKTVYRDVWVPGHWENRHIPAKYRREVRNGREILVLIEEERWERTWVEGRYETHRERVWIEGYWARY